MTDAERISELEAELAQLRARQPGSIAAIRDEISVALTAEVAVLWPSAVSRECLEFSVENDKFEDGWSWHLRVKESETMPYYHAGFAYTDLKLWRTDSGKAQILSSVRKTAKRVVAHVQKFTGEKT